MFFGVGSFSRTRPSSHQDSCLYPLGTDSFSPQLVRSLEPPSSPRSRDIWPGFLGLSYLLASVPAEGIEPSPALCRSAALPLDETGWNLAGGARLQPSVYPEGFEPPTAALSVRCSNQTELRVHAAVLKRGCQLAPKLHPPASARESSSVSALSSRVQRGVPHGGATLRRTRSQGK